MDELNIKITKDEDGNYIAHCIEYDQYGDGLTPYGALQDLSEALEAVMTILQNE
jgi:predicted RNase H-like HicB family nuclease